jgi:beta-N-acetylhexosaminidase
VATARALRGVGIDINLGPVADLAAGPNNTMSGRSFGSDATLIAPQVAAHVDGLLAGGVHPTVKHAPGFGGSTANSDDAVAYIDRSARVVREQDLLPFRAAVEAGPTAIMMSHGIYRGMGRRLPASIDPAMLTLVRRETGFDGVMMTDSMHARGFREAWGDTVPRACPEALRAGIDLLLLTGSLESAVLCRRRVIDAVRSGRLDEARVRDAVRRVRALHEVPAAP